MNRKISIPLIAALFSAMCFYAMMSHHNNAVNESGSLLTQNIEALTQEEYQDSREIECYKSGGNWNMASVCVESGFQTVSCTVSGEVNIFGVVLKGSYTRGGQYTIPWARYECRDSKGNCCKKQGLYTGGTQIA